MLQDKVIVITGASGGIGMEIARALAAEGVRLLLTARRQTKLEAIQTELIATRAEVAIFSGDVTIEADCQAIAQAAVEAFGRIDVLINNAGYGPPGSLQETTEALWDVTINSCLKSVYLMTRAVVPLMLQHGNGTILQISSTAGKNGVPNRTAYCAAKWGVEGFTAALRAELSDQGIRVHSVNPGPVATPWWETAGNAQPQDVLDRMVQPEDVAETVRWLLNQAEKVRIDEVVVQPKQNPGIQR
jgi:NADP-dependent 3-hydroxy acid dehydrogenase YdfG